MSLVLLGCADQLIFYFYVVKYNSLDPLCCTIFHCAPTPPCLQYQKAEAKPILLCTPRFIDLPLALIHHIASRHHFRLINEHLYGFKLLLQLFYHWMRTAWSSLYSLLSLITNWFLKSKGKRLAKWKMIMTFLQTFFQMILSQID